MFWKAVRHHGVLLVALPLITIALALFFAFLLNVGGGTPRRRDAGGLGVEVLPGGVLLPPGPGRGHRRRASSAGSTRPDESGMINGLLDRVGVGPGAVPGRPDLALWSIIGVLVWQAVGFYVVLFSAGMALHPGGDLRGGRARRRQPGHACSSGSPCRCCGTRCRSPGSTWASPPSTRSPWSRCIVRRPGRPGRRHHRAAAWRSTATPSTTRKYGYASAMGVALFFLTITFAALTLRVTRREPIEL